MDRAAEVAARRRDRDLGVEVWQRDQRPIVALAEVPAGGRPTRAAAAAATSAPAAAAAASTTLPAPIPSEVPPPPLSPLHAVARRPSLLLLANAAAEAATAETDPDAVARAAHPLTRAIERAAAQLVTTVDLPSVTLAALSDELGFWWSRQPIGVKQAAACVAACMWGEYIARCVVPDEIAHYADAATAAVFSADANLARAMASVRLRLLTGRSTHVAPAAAAAASQHPEAAAAAATAAAATTSPAPAAATVTLAAAYLHAIAHIAALERLVRDNEMTAIQLRLFAAVSAGLLPPQPGPPNVSVWSGRGQVPQALADTITATHAQYMIAPPPLTPALIATVAPPPSPEGLPMPLGEVLADVEEHVGVGRRALQVRRIVWPWRLTAHFLHLWLEAPWVQARKQRASPAAPPAGRGSGGSPHSATDAAGSPTSPGAASPTGGAGSDGGGLGGVLEFRRRLAEVSAGVGSLMATTAYQTQTVSAFFSQLRAALAFGFRHQPAHYRLEAEVVRAAAASTILVAAPGGGVGSMPRPGSIVVAGSSAADVLGNPFEVPMPSSGATALGRLGRRRRSSGQSGMPSPTGARPRRRSSGSAGSLSPSFSPSHSHSHQAGAASTKRRGAAPAPAPPPSRPGTSGGATGSLGDIDIDARPVTAQSARLLLLSPSGGGAGRGAGSIAGDGPMSTGGGHKRTSISMAQILASSASRTEARLADRSLNSWKNTGALFEGGGGGGGGAAVGRSATIGHVRRTGDDDAALGRIWAAERGIVMPAQTLRSLVDARVAENVAAGQLALGPPPAVSVLSQTALLGGSGAVAAVPAAASSRATSRGGGRSHAAGSGSGGGNAAPTIWSLGAAAYEGTTMSTGAVMGAAVRTAAAGSGQQGGPGGMSLAALHARLMHASDRHAAGRRRRGATGVVIGEELRHADGTPISAHEVAMVQALQRQASAKALRSGKVELPSLQDGQRRRGSRAPSSRSRSRSRSAAPSPRIPSGDTSKPAPASLADGDATGVLDDDADGEWEGGSSAPSSRVTTVRTLISDDITPRTLIAAASPPQSGRTLAGSPTARSLASSAAPAPADAATSKTPAGGGSSSIGDAMAAADGIADPIRGADERGEGGDDGRPPPLIRPPTRDSVRSPSVRSPNGRGALASPLSASGSGGGRSSPSRAGSALGMGRRGSGLRRGSLGKVVLALTAAKQALHIGVPLPGLPQARVVLEPLVGAGLPSGHVSLAAVVGTLAASSAVGGGGATRPGSAISRATFAAGLPTTTVGADHRDGGAGLLSPGLLSPLAASAAVSTAAPPRMLVAPSYHRAEVVEALERHQPSKHKQAADLSLVNLRKTAVPSRPATPPDHFHSRQLGRWWDAHGYTASGRHAASGGRSHGELRASASAGTLPSALAPRTRTRGSTSSSTIAAARMQMYQQVMKPTRPRRGSVTSMPPQPIATVAGAAPAASAVATMPSTAAISEALHASSQHLQERANESAMLPLAPTTRAHALGPQAALHALPILLSPTVTHTMISGQRRRPRPHVSDAGGGPTAGRPTTPQSATRLSEEDEGGGDEGGEAGGAAVRVRSPGSSAGSDSDSDFDVMEDEEGNVVMVTHDGKRMSLGARSPGGRRSSSGGSPLARSRAGSVIAGQRRRTSATSPAMLAGGAHTRRASGGSVFASDGRHRRTSATRRAGSPAPAPATASSELPGLTSIRWRSTAAAVMRVKDGGDGGSAAVPGPQAVPRLPVLIGGPAPAASGRAGGRVGIVRQISRMVGRSPTVRAPSRGTDADTFLELVQLKRLAPPPVSEGTANGGAGAGLDFSRLLEAWSHLDMPATVQADWAVRLSMPEAASIGTAAAVETWARAADVALAEEDVRACWGTWFTAYTAVTGTMVLPAVDGERDDGRPQPFPAAAAGTAASSPYVVCRVPTSRTLRWLGGLLAALGSGAGAGSGGLATSRIAMTARGIAAGAPLATARRRSVMAAPALPLLTRLLPPLPAAPADAGGAPAPAAAALAPALRSASAFVDSTIAGGDGIGSIPWRLPATVHAAFAAACSDDAIDVPHVAAQLASIVGVASEVSSAATASDAAQVRLALPVGALASASHALLPRYDDLSPYVLGALLLTGFACLELCSASVAAAEAAIVRLSQPPGSALPPLHLQLRGKTLAAAHKAFMHRHAQWSVWGGGGGGAPGGAGLADSDAEGEDGASVPLGRPGSQ